MYVLLNEFTEEVTCDQCIFIGALRLQQHIINGQDLFRLGSKKVPYEALFQRSLLLAMLTVNN